MQSMLRNPFDGEAHWGAALKSVSDTGSIRSVPAPVSSISEIVK